MEYLSDALQPQNPYQKEYPDRLSHTFERLPQPYAAIRFNRSGQLLACAGQFSSELIVLDRLTRAVVRRWQAGRWHAPTDPRTGSGAIVDLDWSANSRYVLTIGSDHRLVVFDLARPSHAQHAAAQIIDLPFQPYSVQFHPRTAHVILLLSSHALHLIDRRHSPPLIRNVSAHDLGLQRANQPPPAFSAASFHPTGRYIFLITDPAAQLKSPSSCTLHVLRTSTLAPLLAVPDLAPGPTRSIHIDHSTGTNLLISSAPDRTLRIYTIPLAFLSTLTPIEPRSQSQTSSSPPGMEVDAEEDRNDPKRWELQHRIRDVVDRLAFNTALFSHDADYICANTLSRGEHQIFIWSRLNGLLVHTLDGPKHDCLDLDWHPTEPIIASSSDAEEVHIWTTTTSQNWAAFAPGFDELQENLIHRESEDIFDLGEVSPEELQKRKEEAVVDFSAPLKVSQRSSKLSRPADYTETEQDLAEDAWADAEQDDDGDPSFYPFIMLETSTDDILDQTTLAAARTEKSKGVRPAVQRTKSASKRSRQA